MQVAAEYVRDTETDEAVRVEHPVRLLKSSRKSKGMGDLRFGLSVLIGSFVLIELATKFH